MLTITARNVNQAYVDGLWMMRVLAKVEESRNGRVLTLPTPLVTTYLRPEERVLFSISRNANPYFHLMESVWMLAGSDSLAFVESFNANMIGFSDNGTTLHGAYGHRWRQHFEQDQLENVVSMLRENPISRRIVLTMWDPQVDLEKGSADLPCNTHIYFRVVGGKLNMTILCRSNDIIWGAYGANAVHFSILHEFVARAADIPIGVMIQFSNNLHIYERHWPLMEIPLNNTPVIGYPSVIPLFERGRANIFLEDCENLVRRNTTWFATPFFNRVIAPALFSWKLYKEKRLEDAYDALDEMVPCDWRTAMYMWLDRRAENAKG